MCPFHIDEKKLENLTTLDLAKPPVEYFPHEEFPRLVYKHPKKPTKVIYDIIGQERVARTVPTEHQIRSVADKKELDAALKEGFQIKPYIPYLPAEVEPDEE